MSFILAVYGRLLRHAAQLGHTFSLRLNVVNRHRIGNYLDGLFARLFFACGKS